ncbi:MAG: carbohydrate-binding domain-containing protein, partial [Bacteroidales bacterium]|nr:carbohydrate-binding domain-containing protein [Bacteroidales bacterium]
MKRITLTALLFASMLALPTTGCKSIFEDNEYSGAKVATDDQDDGGNVDVPENPDDYTLSTDTSKIAYIHCKNTSFAVDGNASLVDIKTTGVKIELKKPGTFYIDGTLDDGQIQVDADSADVIKVVFNGVTLNCSSEAPFRVKDCEKTIVTIADGTQNTITDGKANSDSAAIYSKRYLAFNAGEKGTGSLSITANCADGISCTKQLVFNNGTYSVTAADDGMRGKLSLVIHDGKFTVNAQGDAFKSTSDKEGYGYTLIDKGTFEITSGDEGFQSDGTITINGGTFNIKKSEKCIAALGDITINGGDFTLTPTVAYETETSNGGWGFQNEPDGSGHGICIKKNDDDLRTGNVTINGGKINITDSYEGIQGVVITINDGEVWVKSDDDSFNASNGTEQMGGGWGQRPGQQTTTTTPALNFNGGFVYVQTTGDGIDSNGELNITGGVVLVSQNGQANEPIDAGDGYEPKITGGVVIAAGSQGMASAPSTTQTAFFTSATGSANQVFAVNDSDDKNIIAWKIPQAYQVITVSTSKMTTGSYSIITNATVKGDEYVSGSGFYYPA